MGMTLQDVARLAGVGYWQVTYAHRAGVLPEPSRVGGRRVYSQGEAQAVVDFFARRSGEAGARKKNLINGGE